MQDSSKNILKITGIGCLSFLVMIGLLIYLASWLTSGMAKTAEDQLAAIKAGDIEKAYSLTSSDFKKATPFGSFKVFIRDYPMLATYDSVNFDSRKVQDETGELEGDLKTKQGKFRIKYQMVKEYGQWLIQGMKLEGSGTPPSLKGAMKVVRLETGTRFNPGDNSVKDSRQSFKPSESRIYCSVHITGARKGSLVTALLSKGKDKMGQASTKLSNMGSVVTAFNFTGPETGWQKGQYELTIALDGKKAAYTRFVVR